MHTASSTPLHEPRQAPASLPRPLWLQTPAAPRLSISSHQDKDHQNNFISLSASSLPVWHPFACPSSRGCLGQGVLLRYPVWRPGCRAGGGLPACPPFFPLLPSRGESRKLDFVYLKLGFSQKSAFSEEPQLQMDTAKAKKTPPSQGYGFASSDEKPHEEKWDSSHLPRCFPWSNNSSLLKDTIITESRSSLPGFERGFKLCIRTDKYLKKKSTLSS